MFKVVAFLYFVSVLSGPEASSRGFKTMDECRQFIAGFPEFIEKHNRSENPDKVVEFTVVCSAVKKAPSGAV